MLTEIEERDRKKLDEIAAAVNKALATEEEQEIHTAYCTCKDKAKTIKHTDVKQAIDLLLSSRELSEQLGYRYGIGIVQHELGHIINFN